MILAVFRVMSLFGLVMVFSSLKAQLFKLNDSKYLNRVPDDVNFKI